MTNSVSMGELCALMMQQRLDSELFTEWVERHYGLPDIHGSAELVHWVAFHHQEPHPLDRLRVLEFDKFLTRSGVEDCEFTRALIELRNVFARNANMAASTSVDLDSTKAPAIADQNKPPALRPPASAEFAEVLAKLLCAESRKARSELNDAISSAA